MYIDKYWGNYIGEDVYKRQLVGTLPPFTDQPCHSYGGWDDGYDVYLQILSLIHI